jgi:hypothetical protein
MKDIKLYINESTESEELHEEIGRALREFGSIKHGFKMVNFEDVENAMYKLGFDFVEEESGDDRYVFVGDYIDHKYEVTLFSEDSVKGKIKIKNFNEILA